MITYRKAENDKDIQLIAELAKIIWNEHFTPLIGKEQVDYMLDKFQSYHAISDAVNNDGYVYYMAFDDDSLAGYLGAHPEDDCVFLSKIYVERGHRRLGIASKMLELVKADFADKNYMYLTVNKHNDIAVSTYNALGFTLRREQVTDIGHGFVMDDYVFRYDL